MDNILLGNLNEKVNYRKGLLLFICLSYSSFVFSEEMVFKSPVGGLYTLQYNNEYTGANVLKLTMTHVSDDACAKLAPELAGKYFEVQVNSQYVPLTPPASGTTWNRNYVVADKAAALCQSGKNNTIIVNHFIYPKTYALYNENGDIVSSTSGSSAKETIVNSSYEIYRKTMQIRESHQLSVK